MQIKSFVEEYSSALSQQKRIIETNFYARELEQKYHKSNKRPLVQQVGSGPVVDEPALWPIESQGFTEVLKAKLRNVTCKVTPSEGINKKVLAELHKGFHTRFQSEGFYLPKVDKSRFWSPLKAKSRINCYKEMAKEVKEFGPKVKSIQFQFRGGF